MLKPMKKLDNKTKEDKAAESQDKLQQSAATLEINQRIQKFRIHVVEW